MSVPISRFCVQLIKVAHLPLILPFGGLTIIPVAHFKGATGDSERSNLVSFVTLTTYLILVDNLGSNLSVMPNLSILSFILSSLKSSKLLIIKLIFALASLSSVLLIKSELFNNFIVISEVGIATTTPVTNAAIIFCPPDNYILDGCCQVWCIIEN